jgi:hypothetical protein
MQKRTTIATTGVVVSNSSSKRKEKKKNAEDINPFSYFDGAGIKQGKEKERK